ncbi:glutamine--fructose-6-phosphate transaminase (isomerizing) [bacterium]|nr:glutamine--fructose-6-phosphate transaminase (isomerizing) [bacterium]
MCGIIGYIGDKNCSDILLQGLSKLEYRGYDSAGIAILNNNNITRLKTEGKLQGLYAKVYLEKPEGTIGIGHTRWATHGAPTTINAHPHSAGKFTIIHNGIIENYKELKSYLQKEGAIFSTETDSEIIAHLLDLNSKNLTFEEAVVKTISKLEGAFAVLVLFEEAEKIVAFKQHSPMVIGVGSGEMFVASDIPALLEYTKRFIFMNDGELAILEKNSFNLYDFSLNSKEYKIETLNISPLMAEKGNYKHFMLKEIFEQNRSISDTFRGRVLNGGEKLDLDTSELNDFFKNSLKRVIITACGTSWHAGLVGKYLIEHLARVPVEVDYASEYRYRSPIVDENSLIIAISQSGETADTLFSIKMAKEMGAKVLSICNVFQSSIPRSSDAVLYTYAGPEIGVASTKAFTTQLAVIIMLAIHLKECKTGELDVKLLKELLSIPEKIDGILQNSELILELAQKYHHFRDFLFLGRGLNFPIALEGALKLKEISYIHAEGYPSGEMKHGPIALVDEDMPTIIMATKNNQYEKVLSNLQEIRARSGKVIAIATEGNNSIKEFCDDIFFVPESSALLEPFFTVIPLQLFAYYVADIKGTDVDQPRNLAKCVTVE